MSKNYVVQCTSENGLEIRIHGEMFKEKSDAIPEPIHDWDDEPTVEIPAQTMRDVVYGTEDTAPVAVPGQEPIGPSRPTRDIRPLGRGRKGR